MLLQKNQTWLTIPKAFRLMDTDSGLSRKRNVLIRAALSWLISILAWPLLPRLLHLQRCVSGAVIYQEVFWQVDVQTAHVAVFCFVWPRLYLGSGFAPALHSWSGEEERELGLSCSEGMVISMRLLGLCTHAFPVDFSQALASEHQDEILKIDISLAKSHSLPDQPSGSLCPCPRWNTLLRLRINAYDLNGIVLARG